MSTVIRHDAIALLAGTDATAFERFMATELMPHLAERFKGPTRVSIADLKALSLLRDAKSKRNYLLVTQWVGPADAVRGPAFEKTRMNSAAKTGELFDALSSFGKRSTEKVFGELVALDVPTHG